MATVFDGDSIRLSDGTEVRYLGVNTPEYGHPFAEEAKQYNEQLTLGKRVRLVTGSRKRDGYGRVLAYVYVDTALVNARLIAAGWGHLFVLDPIDRYEEWLQLQKNAQAQRKGIWRNGVPPLKITRVKADAKGDDRRNPNDEYVRICNVRERPIEIQGFSIQDAGPHRYTFPPATLAPGYTALLRSGKGQDDPTGRKRQLVFYWGSEPIWNNDGDTASMFDPNGRLIDAFSYGKRLTPPRKAR